MGDPPGVLSADPNRSSFVRATAVAPPVPGMSLPHHLSRDISSADVAGRHDPIVRCRGRSSVADRSFPYADAPHLATVHQRRHSALRTFPGTGPDLRCVDAADPNLLSVDAERVTVDRDRLADDLGRGRRERKRQKEGESETHQDPRYDERYDTFSVRSTERTEAYARIVFRRSSRSSDILVGATPRS